MIFATKVVLTFKIQNMRKRFEQQFQLGVKLISETPVLLKSRDDIPALTKALLEIYNTPEYNTKIFKILEDKILKGKKKTGRNGLNLWLIFVLAQFRLALNIDYDRLHHMANSDSTLRQLLGIETESGFKRITIGYQRILDNLHLLDEATLKQINDVVVSFGHNTVFKKKETAALSVKTDSFAVESNVHFPTDYSLLLDSSRKSIGIISWFTKKYPQLKGWRKSKDWFRSLKNLSRTVGQSSSSGGKDKAERVKKTTKQYLRKADAFRNKLENSKADLPINEERDLTQIFELERFMILLDKHIDLVKRRILKGEKIPHQEKLFSIFEQYTEWISKGKRRPNVELGKLLSITTDQYGLIIDYHIHENEKDPQVVLSIADRILLIYCIKNWSFDRGYWNKEIKLLLETEIEKVIMPKKGKRTIEQTKEERTPVFKHLKNKHSSVESNINELEHRGLDRCPDRGYHGFKRYVGMGIVAYNLHRIGKALLKQELENQKKTNRRKMKSVA